MTQERPSKRPPQRPLQADLFSGELIDNRNRRQKRRERERAAPNQPMMFSQREIAQFGVKARPRMSLSPHTRLRLLVEDPRTEEEREADLRREAERNTYILPGFEAFRSAEADNENLAAEAPTPSAAAARSRPEEEDNAPAGAQREWIGLEGAFRLRLEVEAVLLPAAGPALAQLERTLDELLTLFTGLISSADVPAPAQPAAGDRSASPPGDVDSH